MSIELRYRRSIGPDTLPEGLQCTVIRKRSSRPLAGTQAERPVNIDSGFGAACAALKAVRRARRLAW